MARTWLQSWMAHCGVEPQTAQDTALVFSEVVTNAVLHGRGPVTVSAHLEPGQISCAVSDHAPDLPVLQRPLQDDEHHRGLHLVAALATTWWAQPLIGGGKTVAFTICTPM